MQDTARTTYYRPPGPCPRLTPPARSSVPADPQRVLRTCILNPSSFILHPASCILHPLDKRSLFGDRLPCFALTPVNMLPLNLTGSGKE